MLTDMPYKVRPASFSMPTLLMVSLLRADLELYLLQYHTLLHDASPTNSRCIFLLLLDFVSGISAVIFENPLHSFPY